MAQPNLVGVIRVGCYSKFSHHWDQNKKCQKDNTLLLGSQLILWGNMQPQNVPHMKVKQEQQKSNKYVNYYRQSSPYSIRKYAMLLPLPVLALNHITLPVLAPSTLDSPQSLYYSLLRLIKIITFINAILKNLTQTWYWNWVRKQSNLHNDSVILHTVLTPPLSQLCCSSTNTWVHVWGFSPGRVFRSSDGLNELQSVHIYYIALM